MRLGIGCLTMIMMLGTVLFSVQAFCFASQPVVFQYSVSGNNSAVSDNNGQWALDGAVSAVSGEAGDPDKHAMDARPESNGFFAVPWISVSYIRQSIGEASLLQCTRRLTRSFLFSAYPSDRTTGVTDRTVRSRSNPTFLVQALDLRIARLTAG